MTRRGTRADLAQVVAWEQQCFGADAWSRDLVTAAVDANEVLLDEAGFVVVRVVNDVADLDRIAVVPEQRRSGHGQVLLSAGVSAARDRGAERMLLEVAADNVAAIGLYVTAGFAEIHRRRNYYGAGRDAVVMELQLDDSNHPPKTVQ